MATGRNSSTVTTWCTVQLILHLLVLLLLPVVSAQNFDPMVICQGKPDDTTVMNPVSCQLFMICKNNYPSESGQCPDNMLFNAKMEYCDFPDNVDCGTLPRPPGFEQTSEATTPEATTTTIPEASEAPGESCPAVDDPVIPTYLAVLDDCSAYILCYHGNPLKMKCPVGLEWNRQDSMCDKPQNAKCQAIFQDPFGCPATGTVIIAHPYQCQKYIFCLEGISWVQVCQMFKIFDPTEGKCVLGTC